ncbi:MAG: ABC transporter permease [Clostridia bacterium]|nr:ABC transporter permease [Clostridia bacterium]
MIIRQFRELYDYREMFKNLVAKDLRSRYKGSVLGFLWTFINPLMMLIVYSIVFSFVMRANIENYSMFLFVGLLPWNYFQGSITMGNFSIVGNANLINKIYFPRAILPLAAVASNLVNYFLSLVIMVPALLFFDIKLTIAIVAFPVVLIVQTLFVTALTLLVAAANVKFRDLQHITGVLLMAWFFLTPVLFPSSMVPDKIKPYFALNVMSPVIEAYRDIFFYGHFPDFALLGKLALLFFLMLLLSYVLFNHLQKNFAEEL